MDFKKVAGDIRDLKNNIILIFAFNGAGKTRLSVEYKNLTKEPETHDHTGVYYNAYSEDLFVWFNDEGNDNENIRLDIIPSSLNQFHTFLSKEIIIEKLKMYNPTFDFSLNLNGDQEKGIDSFSFFIPDSGPEKPIKISRGEERIFVWCFFLALFEVDAWTGTQDAHLFIDDPVSSLDEHNIFITANSILDLVKEYYLKRKVIVTTHHIGLFSILVDRLCKGGKSGGFKNLTSTFSLSLVDKELVLKKRNDDVFLFHLHLLQVLELAINTELFRYHFVLLRQLLENIGSFLGVGFISYTLEQIGFENKDEVADLVNSLSHKDAYSFQFSEMAISEKEIFIDIFERVKQKYNFVLHS